MAELILNLWGTNTGFRTDTTGYAGAGGATITRSTSIAKAGTASGYIAWPAAAAAGAARIDYTVTGLTTGQTYTVAVWAYAPTVASLACAPKLFVSGVGYSGGTVTAAVTWTLLQRTFTATGASHVVSVVNSAAIAAAGQTLYIDQALIIASGTAVTDTWDGDTIAAGYVHWWTGAGDTGTSARGDTGVWLSIIGLGGTLAQIVPVVVLDWTDTVDYLGQLVPIMGSDSAVDVPPSAGVIYGPRRATVELYGADAAAAWQLQQWLSYSSGRVRVTSDIPGLSMYRARVTTLRRALDPANVPTRRWPITVELTQIWTAS
jgi:hypothetical protein